MGVAMRSFATLQGGVATRETLNPELISPPFLSTS
jgi:hypothetical protein